MKNNYTTTRMPIDEKTKKLHKVLLLTLSFITFCFIVSMKLSLHTILYNPNFISIANILKNSKDGAILIKHFPVLLRFNNILTAKLVNHSLYIPLFMNMLLTILISSKEDDPTLSALNEARDFMILLIKRIVLTFLLYLGFMLFIGQNWVKIIVVFGLAVTFIVRFLNCVKENQLRAKSASLIKKILLIALVSYILHLSTQSTFYQGLKDINELLSTRFFLALLTLTGLYSIKKPITLFKKNFSKLDLNHKISKILGSFSFFSVITFLYLIPSTGFLSIEGITLIISANLAFYLYEQVESKKLEFAQKKHSIN